MSKIDVSDVLLDPDFMDKGLVCERIAQTIDSHGRASNTTTNTPFTGVVTSGAGDKLNRTAEGDRTSGNITIHTRFELIAGSGSTPADVIQWQGRRYTVTLVSDWSNWGRGFYAVSCDLIPLKG